MSFQKAMRKVGMDFKRLLEPKPCLDGEHCPEYWPTGVNANYLRFHYPIGICLHSAPSTDSPVANRLIVTPIQIPFRRRVVKLGIQPGLVVSGNFMLAFYADLNEFPEVLVCGTASTAVATLTANHWSWITPTSTPIIDAGLYYIGSICNESYVGGVSGMQLNRTSLATGGTPFDAFGGSYRQDVGAFTLPDPMVEVAHNPTYVYKFGVKLGES